jgi:hypothetical protein
MTAALPVAASSISRSERRRLAAIGLACTVACALLGLLICAAVFGSTRPSAALAGRCHHPGLSPFQLYDLPPFSYIAV